MPASATLFIGEPPAPDKAAKEDQQQEPEAVGLHQFAGADEKTGGARQLLAHVFKLGNHLGHHGGKEDRDDPDSHAGEHDGVDHRLQQLGAHMLALFGVVGEAVEHLLQMARFFTGRHHGAKQLIEHMGKGPQRVGQRITFHHLAAHGRHQRAQVRFFALLGHRFERLFDGETGPHQSGQLASDQSQLGGGGAAPEQGEAGRFPFRLLGGLVHLEGSEPLFAQQLAYLTGGIPLHHAALAAPLVIEGLVFECRHLNLPGSRAVPLRGWFAP